MNEYDQKVRQQAVCGSVGAAASGQNMAAQSQQKQRLDAVRGAAMGCCEGEARPEFGFDGALNHIKEGRCVARRGWNGRGIFVYLTKGAAHFSDQQAIPPLIDGIKRSLFEQWDGGIVTRCPNISIQSASGNTVNGWAPSQTDMLAEDWYVA